VVPHKTASSCAIDAGRVITGGLSEIDSGFSLIMANSHADNTASRIGTAHYEIGFPVFKTLGYLQRVTIGYRGTTAMVHDMANLLTQEVHR
jgi:nitrogenase molybdenum-iron protein NifN